MKHWSAVWAALALTTACGVGAPGEDSGLGSGAGGGPGSSGAGGSIGTDSDPYALGPEFDHAKNYRVVVDAASLSSKSPNCAFLQLHSTSGEPRQGDAPIEVLIRTFQLGQAPGNGYLMGNLALTPGWPDSQGSSFGLFASSDDFAVRQTDGSYRQRYWRARGYSNGIFNARTISSHARMTVNDANNQITGSVRYEVDSDEVELNGGGTSPTPPEATTQGCWSEVTFEGWRVFQ